MQHQHPEREKAVFRTAPIPVSAFDHIKDTQRAIRARTGQAVTLNEVSALIVHEHKHHTQSAVREDQKQVPSILQNRT